MRQNERIILIVVGGNSFSLFEREYHRNFEVFYLEDGNQAHFSEQITYLSIGIANKTEAFFNCC